MSERAHTRRFASAIALRFASDALGLVFRVALLGVVTRHLGQEPYGVFSQASTTAAMLMPLFSLRLSVACVRFFPELAGDGALIWQRYSLSVGVIMLAGITGICASFLLAGSLAQLVFDHAEYAELVPLLIVYAAAQALVMHTIDFYRAVNETHTSSWFSVLRAVLNVASVWLTLRFLRTPAALLSTLSAADALLAAVILVAIRARSSAPSGRDLQQRWREFTPYLVHALPYVPYSLFVLAGAVGDRYFITHWLGITSAGRYAFSYGIVSAAMLFSNSIAYVLLPSIARLWEEKDVAKVQALLAQSQHISLFFAVPIACGLTLSYPALVQAIAGGGFAIDRFSVAAIAGGHVLLSLFTLNSYVVDLAKQSMVLPRIAAAALAINVALNAVLIPKLQLPGAALATLLTYIAQWLLIRRRAHSLVGFEIPFSARFVLTVLLGAVVMTLGLVYLDLLATTTQVFGSTVIGAAIYLLVTWLGAGRDLRARLISSLAHPDAEPR